jgi:hypothetical protein
MSAWNLHEVLVAMAIGTFILGAITFLVGVVILVVNTVGRDLKTLATQTTKLAQKGLAEEISGLVGNASALLSAMNNMVHTAAGIGLFLTVMGALMMGAGYWLILQIR